MSQEEKGLFMCWIILLGMIASLGFHYLQTHLCHRAWPYNTFLFNPDDSWNDFLTYFRALQAGKPFSIKGNVYFPIIYLLLYALIWLKPGIAFAAVAILFISFAAVFVRSCLPDIRTNARRLIVTVLVFASYPTLFCLDRGNLEMVVFIFLALFIYCYRQGRTSLSTIFLAAAGAIKIYPLVFGVLLIADRNYKQVAQTAILILLLLLVPAVFLPGGFRTTWLDLGGNLHILQRQIKSGDVGLYYSTGIFSVLMTLGHFIFKEPFPDIYNAIEWIYPVGCLLAFAGITIYLIKVETCYWKRTAFLTFAMLLFPQISHDYKLIHLLIPITAFLAAPADIYKEADKYYAWLFALLLVPKAYFFVSPNVSISVFINPFLMCVMMLSLGLHRYRHPAS